MIDRLIEDLCVILWLIYNKKLYEIAFIWHLSTLQSIISAIQSSLSSPKWRLDRIGFMEEWSICFSLRSIVIDTHSNVRFHFVEKKKSLLYNNYVHFHTKNHLTRYLRKGADNFNVKFLSSVALRTKQWQIFSHFPDILHVTMWTNLNFLEYDQNEHE